MAFVDAENYYDYQTLCILYGDGSDDDDGQPPDVIFWIGGSPTRHGATRQGLDENRLDGLATTHGWKKKQLSRRQAARMASYFRQDMVEFLVIDWNGRVGMDLDHPRQTQLFFLVRWTRTGRIFL
jgi:hypothetical protein